LNTELVTIKKATREIGNIISAVIHSPDKSISSIQKQNVSKLCNDFADAYSRIDEIEKKIFDKIKELSTQNGLDADVAKKVLEKFNVLDQVKRDIIKQYRLTELFNIEYCLNNREWDEHTSAQIDKEVLDLESNFLNQKSKFNISETIHFANPKVISFSVHKSDFYVSLINGYLSSCDTEKTKIDIVLEAVTILEKIYNKKNEKNEENEKRDDSKPKKYINSLLANLQGSGDFSVSAHNDIFLQSLSIFVQSKNEIDRIEKTLIDNLIPDFHFAFGLWGAFWGFANMPKTLTNELFLSDDLDYVSEVYKYIFKQIHGIELEGKIERKQVLCQSDRNTNSTIDRDDISVKNERSSDKTTSHQSIILEAIFHVKNENKYQEYEEILKDLERSSNGRVSTFIESVQSSKINKVTNLYKKLIEFLKPHIEEPFSNSQETKPTHEKDSNAEKGVNSKKETKPEKEFYKDPNAFDFIEPLLPDDTEIKKQFRNDLDWFQDNYKEQYYDKKKGNKKGRYFEKEKNNEKVISYFNDHLKEKISQTHWRKQVQSIRDIYIKIDIEKIIKELKSHYLYNERQN
jgi:hypothetical protein